MIRLILKLAVAALIANAAWRVGSEYLAHYRFRDAVRESAMYKAGSDAELRQRVLALASQFDIPLDDDALTIRREARQVTIEGSYAKPIDLLPGYTYPWQFDWSIEVYLATPPRPGGR
jgi:hypothetical protein